MNWTKSTLQLAALAMVAACATPGPKPPASQPASQPATQAVAPPPAPPPLIPREDLFGNPERAQGRFSPDGNYMSWLAPRDGVLNVWVQKVGDGEEARPITHDKSRGIRQHFWAYDGRTVLYIQDRGGDENFRLYAVNVETNEEKDLTPLEGVRAIVMGLSEERPGVVLVGLNDRKPEWHDVYEVDLATAKRKLVYKNTNEFGSFVADDNLRLVLATKERADGSSVVVRRLGGRRWRRVLVIPYEDGLTSYPLSLTDKGDLLMIDSRARDKSGLFRVDVRTGRSTLIAENDKADLSTVLTHPVTDEPLAVSVDYLRSEWTILDESVREDFEVIGRELEGDFAITSVTQDMKRWMLIEIRSDAPSRYLTYDRESKAVSPLFTTRPALADAPLVPMQPVIIESRDGLELVSYLTLPRGSDADGDGKPETPVPMVLDVHGGPWARDQYRLDVEAQWFADRGYATLQVNFRGSTGFGKTFTNAGDRQWGRTMHNDLIDAVESAVNEGITEKDTVAIYGGSYGGYATLAGLTFTPDTFACGVDIVGPSNLITLLSTIPPYWKSFFEQLARRVGDPRTEEGLALLKERSPLTHADKIVRPLLIAQGANDPRVKKAESDQIVTAMKEKGIPVTYALFPDEGHGFARPENRLAFYGVTESFLAKCLRGRAQPIGDDFTGSSITFPSGIDAIPGLEQAYQAHTAAGAGSVKN